MLVDLLLFVLFELLFFLDLLFCFPEQIFGHMCELSLKSVLSVWPVLLCLSRIPFLGKFLGLLLWFLGDYRKALFSVFLSDLGLKANLLRVVLLGLHPGLAFLLRSRFQALYAILKDTRHVSHRDLSSQLQVSIHVKIFVINLSDCGFNVLDIELLLRRPHQGLGLLLSWLDI